MRLLLCMEFTVSRSNIGVLAVNTPTAKNGLARALQWLIVHLPQVTSQKSTASAHCPDMIQPPQQLFPGLPPQQMCHLYFSQPHP